MGAGIRDDLKLETYLVGGAVRDRLLGRPVRERDWVVTGATPQEMLAAGFRMKDPGFPVFLHPDSGEEYALARREKKQGQGHKGFALEFGPDVTLEEDLARRDLTVNAMAQDASGTIADPFRGRQDLAARRLRHVTAAFEEDPLRVLRLARFAAELAPLGFTVAADTARLAARMSTGEDLLTLSAGRIWRETARALAAPRPEIYFARLEEFGALARLMPWLDRSGVAVAALGRAASPWGEPAVRLAALAAGAARGGASGAIPDTWPVPAPMRELAALCVAHPPPALGGAEAALAWLEAVDAWRRPERFDRALGAWTSAEPDAGPALARLRAARDAARRVPPPGPGADPRAAVREARLERVREALQRSPAP